MRNINIILNAANAVSVWNDNQTHMRMKDWKTKLKNYYESNFFSSKMTGNVKNKSNSPVNIRFVAETLDIRNFSQHQIWC